MAGKRCKHSNVSCKEHWLSIIHHHYDNGVMNHTHHDGAPTGIWDIKCNDCEQEWTVKRFKKMPKWIEQRIDAATDGLSDGEHYDEAIFSSDEKFREFMSGWRD